jgi:hypothetical protein
MKVVVIDYELPDYVCTNILDGRTMEPLNENQFKEWLSSMDKERIKDWLPYEDSEIYFVDVKDKTWNKFKTKNSKRVELMLDELMKLINESSYLILIKENRTKACTYYPQDDDP